MPGLLCGEKIPWTGDDPKQVLRCLKHSRPHWCWHGTASVHHAGLSLIWPGTFHLCMASAKSLWKWHRRNILMTRDGKLSCYRMEADIETDVRTECLQCFLICTHSIFMHNLLTYNIHMHNALMCNSFRVICQSVIKVTDSRSRWDRENFYLIFFVSHEVLIVYTCS